MRIATMILSLILMLVVGAQSCAVSVGGELANDAGTAEGGAVGILMTLLFLLGGAFVIGVPLVSLISFVFAGVLGLAAGSTTPFTDLTFWGIAALVLAFLSFFGLREKRRQRAESRARVT